LDFNEEVELFNEEDELRSEDCEFLSEAVELLSEAVELLSAEAILDREVSESFLVNLTFSFSEDLLLLLPNTSLGDPSEARLSLSFSDKDCISASGKGCNSVSDSDDCPTGSGRTPR
jgi:hypothetical protein